MSKGKTKKSWSEEVDDTLNDNRNKRIRTNSTGYSEPKSKTRKPLELETDPITLQRRQKQIDYGKNTVGYQNYILHVPFDQRTKRNPKTPEKYVKYSRRSWDTLIKIWRRKLHEYDTESTEAKLHLTDDDDDDDDESDNWDLDWLQ